MRFMLCSLRAPFRGDKRGRTGQTHQALARDQAKADGQHEERQEKVGLQELLHGTVASKAVCESEDFGVQQIRAGSGMRQETWNL
jgi:hypothetical protein